ncbi:MAG: HD domain-containing protein, partial [Anaerolineales bacterium]
ARIASRLFYQSLSLHHLDESDCLLLEVAALLHDIGHFINTIDHDQHGEYIVRHSPLIGLDARQQNIIATIVRLHRKTDPSALQEESFKSLPQKDRLLVTKLCALLRMADSLEVSHTTRVQDVVLERERDNHWRLTLLGASDMMLEKWTLEKRKRLFEEVFGVSLEIH